MAPVAPAAPAVQAVPVAPVVPVVALGALRSEDIVSWLEEQAGRSARVADAAGDPLAMEVASTVGVAVREALGGLQVQQEARAAAGERRARENLASLIGTPERPSIKGVLSPSLTGP